LNEAVIERLRRLGYLPLPAPPTEGFGAAPVPLDSRLLAAALEAYRRFNGLPSDFSTEMVERQLLGARRCGVPDFIASNTARWPSNGVDPVPLILWGRLAIVGFDQPTVNRMIRESCEAWSSRTNVQIAAMFTATTPARVNLRVGIAPIDSRGGILAQAFLPYPGITLNDTLDITFDSNESWASPEYGERLFRPVCDHEVGHALGLPHQAVGTGALMEPYAIPGRQITQVDVAAVDSLYGRRRVQPTPTPTPTPNPTPSPGETIVCEFLGTNGHRLRVVRS
jgi:hypothetical protein